MRWLLRFFLTVFFIALLGSLGYIYVNSQNVEVPDTPVIEIDTLAKEDLLGKKKENIEQVLLQKKAALKHQTALLEKKKALLNKRRQEIENYINNEAEIIREKYQSRIDGYQSELDRKYQVFKTEKEQEFLEQVLVKNELYEDKIIDLISNLEQSHFQELEQYKQDLIKDYYLENINYDLKLKFLELSKDDEEIYRNKLTELEEKQKGLIQGKEQEVIAEIENKVEEFKEQYNTEIEEFEKELKIKIERDLNNRQRINTQLLEDYLFQEQKNMESEIKEISAEIRDRSKDEIATLEALINEISQEHFSLQSEVSILEKEVIY